MCGIAGIFNLDGQPVPPIILQKMTQTIAHRGPDGEGIYIDDFLGFGHRRLSIIDLSAAGHQPMMTSDNNYVITYNGEVYNYQELRIELESLGHQFFSKTDTEVILKSFSQWGPDALLKFNGMFAFAIWDKQKRELFLARDRYGIKPLYYYLDESKLLFGSEIKAIIAHPTYKTQIDKKGLLEYMTFQNFFTEKTLFKDVRLLPAGCFLKIPYGRFFHPKPQRYWDYHFSDPLKIKDEEEYVEELQRLFSKAVSRQLISDVDIGSYLSGGMDSGSITALAATQLPYIKTFTVGFDLSSITGVELAFDERVAAERMSYLFKTEHYEMVLKAGDMERIMSKLTYHLEEPRVGQCYPNFYASKLASRFVKVVLGGAGGDELFGGYPWRYYRAVVNTNFEEYINKYYLFWQRLIPNSQIKEVFRPIWEDVSDILTRDIFRDVFSNHLNELKTPEDYINHSLYFEAKTFLHGLLVVEDKMSMAHGLETRVPFLDNDLVDFAMKVPVSMKLGNLKEVIRVNENEAGSKVEKYFQKNNDGKLVLRKAMKKFIPDEILNREKQGFSAPDASWFKGESIEYVRRKLINKNAKIYEFLDSSAVISLINEHLEGKQNRRLLIWSLLNLECWCENFLTSPNFQSLMIPTNELSKSLR
jgi:asparagine synthase (glutamine-hydrolysing)